MRGGEVVVGNNRGGCATAIATRACFGRGRRFTLFQAARSSGLSCTALVTNASITLSSFRALEELGADARRRPSAGRTLCCAIAVRVETEVDAWPRV